MKAQLEKIERVNLAMTGRDEDEVEALQHTVRVLRWSAVLLSLLWLHALILLIIVKLNS